MLIILLPLACVPLLGLECLRWHHCQGNRRLLRKAFRLAWSSSVFWSLLSGYASAGSPGWSWLFYLLLASGAAYTGICAWMLYGKDRRQRRMIMAVLAYVLVFSLIAWIIPGSTWITLRDHVQSIGSLSRLRGPLH